MRDSTIVSDRHDLRGGFTLLEVLVVLTIIVLIAASALPAFRFITGSRSLESTQNIAGAMIGRVRTAAVIAHQPHGVFFFVDPVNDRTTMAAVKQEGDNTANPDMDAYKAWTDGRDQLPPLPAPVGVTYYDSTSATNGPSFANTLTTFGGEKFGILGNPALTRPTLRMFKCGKFHFPAAVVNSPPTTPFWVPASSLFLDIVANTDFQLLPQGVGVQLMNDQKGRTTANNTYHDRYLRTGCIIVDSNGQFTSVNYDVLPNSKLGKTLKLPNARTLENQNFNAATGVVTFVGNGINGQSYNLFSQFGIVLYDRQALKAANTVGGTTFVPSDESDWLTRNVLTNYTAPATPNDEQNEETWLDRNTQPLILNRYNATLIKGE